MEHTERRTNAISEIAVNIIVDRVGFLIDRVFPILGIRMISQMSNNVPVFIILQQVKIQHLIRLPLCFIAHGASMTIRARYFRVARHRFGHRGGPFHSLRDVIIDGRTQKDYIQGETQGNN